MIPSLQSVAVKHASSRHQHRRASSGSQDLRNQTVLPIHMAQECTEAPRWPCDSVYVANYFEEPTSRHVGEQPGLPTGPSSKLARVRLCKSPTSNHECNKYFVRTAGGMSVSVPEAEHKQTPLPAPQLEDGTLENSDVAVRMPATKSRTSHTNSYLPISVELIGGRGQTSMPGDGNKSSSSTKVRSLPPSHTLAMSASFIKSYFSSGPEKQSKSAGSTPESETSVKTKMLGLWNNVKYGWAVNLKTNFSRDSPVYLLGCVYHKCLGEDEDNSEEDWRYNKNSTQGADNLIHRCIVRWLGDSPSPHCPLSLHNLVHFGQKLGKKAGDWYGPASVAYIFKDAVEMGSKYIPDLQRICIYVAQDCAVYIQDVLDLCFTSCVCNKGNLIKLAKDIHLKPGSSSSLYPDERSLAAMDLAPSHTLKKDTKASEAKYYCNEKPGQNDDGRSAAEVSINGRKSTKESQKETSSDTHDKSSTDEEKKLGSGHSKEPCAVCDNWRSVLIMVPVRLGGEALNPIYAPCLYSLFTHELCVGIIGGRPKHSLYFVGFQEDSLIHLDPHLCQDAVMVTQSNFNLSSYHCCSPRKMALSRMDPSATLGFYCHSRMDFLRLMEEIPELITPKQPGFEYPIFEFVDGRCEDSDACTRQVSTEDEMAACLPGDTPLLPQDSEEFVFL
ncbi:cysteine protease ATG4D isoform X2 [Cherax quadricarinatus]|uniref:cysteine protease ATG4D isoform X2 n=1 Tax=Cherax quadricarinatus TaxID=27406 RepID=UPI00387E6541